MKYKRVVQSIFLLFFASTVDAQVDSLNFTAPANLSELNKHSLWATEYYAHVTRSEGSIPYLTSKGDTLGYFSDICDFCTACLEGTVFIEDPEHDRIVLNYASRGETALINCRECSTFANSTLNVESWGSVRWKISSGFGEGVQGYKLVPYRTVAVDPNVIAYGSVLFIPDAVGSEISISDSTTFLHDGYFFAGDTGGAIKGNHIDVFTGVDDSHPFGFVKSSAKHAYDAYTVENEALIETLENLHR